MKTAYSHSTTQKSLTRKRKAKVIEEGRIRSVLSAHGNPTSFFVLVGSIAPSKPDVNAYSAKNNEKAKCDRSVLLSVKHAYKSAYSVIGRNDLLKLPASGNILIDDCLCLLKILLAGKLDPFVEINQLIFFHYALLHHIFDVQTGRFYSILAFALCYQLVHGFTHA